MNDKIFIDSNIFLYALDRHDDRKRQQAKDLLFLAGSKHRVFVSTQVLNEVYSAATRKLGIDALSAKEFVRGLYDFEIVQITPAIIESAMDCSVLYRLNYWDALMIAAAEAGRCSVLWTEDMRSGEKVRQVEIRNPFLGV